MTNSRESTSIIIIMPPGKILLVVISRSLCECHMKAKPASDDGLFAIVPEGGVPVADVRPHCEARVSRPGPDTGLPPNQAPLVENVRIGQGDRTAAAHIAKRRLLQWLVVVLAPLEIVNRGGIAGVVAVRIRHARQHGIRIAGVGW